MAPMLHDMRYEGHQLVPITRPTGFFSCRIYSQLTWNKALLGSRDKRNAKHLPASHETQLHSKLKSLTLWFTEQARSRLGRLLNSSVLAWIQSSRIQKRLCGQPGQKLQQDFHPLQKVALNRGISSIGVSKNPVSSVHDLWDFVRFHN